LRRSEFYNLIYSKSGVKPCSKNSNTIFIAFGRIVIFSVIVGELNGCKVCIHQNDKIDFVKVYIGTMIVSNHKLGNLVSSKHLCIDHQLRFEIKNSVFNNIGLPLGVKFASRGELLPRGVLRPLGERFTSSFSHPGGNTLYCSEKWRCEQRIFILSG
jgi:hypothetical protein